MFYFLNYDFLEISGKGHQQCRNREMGSSEGPSCSAQIVGQRGERGEIGAGALGWVPTGRGGTWALLK